MGIAVLLLLIQSMLVTGSAGLSVTLLHVNDIHSHFDEVDVNTGRCRGTEADGCFGGMSRMSSFINEVRRSDPNTLLLNAGDYYQGTVWYSLFKYAPVIEFANLLNYTAMALGNHDWDDGPDGLQPFVDQVNFPVLAANLLTSRLNGVGRSTITQVDGVSIGIIGYIIQDTPRLSNPGNEVEFLDEIESVRVEAKLLKARGIGIIIALGHAGYELDLRMAGEIEELDLVVGGHSHTFLYTGKQPSIEAAEGPYPTYVEQRSGRVVPVVQAYCYTKYIGLLSLQFDSEGELKIPVSFAQPILLDGSITKDGWIEEKLYPWRKLLEPYTTPLGWSTHQLTKQNNRESDIGNLVTDSMSESWIPGSIAIINDGGIRTGLAEGEITGEDIFNILPFNNTVDYGWILGKDLKLVFEDAVRGLCPSMTCEPIEFYQVSRLKILYEIRKYNEGNRVKCLQYKNPDGRFEDVESDRMYPVATVSFLLKSGKSKLGEFVRNRSSGPSDYQVLEDYISLHGTVNPTVEGRININYIHHVNHL